MYRFGTKTFSLSKVRKSGRLCPDDPPIDEHPVWVVPVDEQLVWMVPVPKKKIIEAGANCEWKWSRITVDFSNYIPHFRGSLSSGPQGLLRLPQTQVDVEQVTQSDYNTGKYNCVTGICKENIMPPTES
jgi:hypothetical protein